MSPPPNPRPGLFLCTLEVGKRQCEQSGEERRQRRVLNSLFCRSGLTVVAFQKSRPGGKEFKCLQEPGEQLKCGEGAAALEGNCLLKWAALTRHQPTDASWEMWTPSSYNLEFSRKTGIFFF